MSRGRPRTPIPPRADDELAELEQYYLSMGGIGARTQHAHEMQWPKWQRWCEQRGLDPYTATPADVIEYLVDAFPPNGSRSALDNSLRSVRWHYKQKRLEDPTSHPSVKAMVKTLAAEAANAAGPKRSTAAVPLSAKETELVLTAPPPPPSNRALLLRARLLISAALDRCFTDSAVATVPRAEVEVHRGELRFGDLGTLAPTDDAMTCPVQAWRAFDDAAPVDRPFALGGIIASTADDWRLLSVSKASSLAVSALRTAFAQCFGPDVAFDLKTPVSSAVGHEDLRRLWVLVDPALASHWRDDAILALQIWGGCLAVDVARLTMDLVQDDPLAVLLTLSWCRDEQRNGGQVRAISELPDQPELCGATALRAWLWLARHRLSTPDAPLVPVMGPQSVLPPRLRAYDIDGRPSNTSMALSKPLKGRLVAAGLPTEGRASSAGRATLRSLASEGGAAPRDVQEHLGVRTDQADLSHLAPGGIAASNPTTAPNDMSWEDPR